MGANVKNMPLYYGKRNKKHTWIFVWIEEESRIFKV